MDPDNVDYVETLARDTYTLLILTLSSRPVTLLNASYTIVIPVGMSCDNVYRPVFSLPLRDAIYSSQVLKWGGFPRLPPDSLTKLASS